jgi:hypothetical protein
VCGLTTANEIRTSPSVSRIFFHHLTICGETSSRARRVRDRAKADIMIVVIDAPVLVALLFLQWQSVSGFERYRQLNDAAARACFLLRVSRACVCSCGSRAALAFCVAIAIASSVVEHPGFLQVKVYKTRVPSSPSFPFLIRLPPRKYCGSCSSVSASRLSPLATVTLIVWKR